MSEKAGMERLIDKGMPDGQKTECCKYRIVADTGLTVAGYVRVLIITFI